MAAALSIVAVGRLSAPLMPAFEHYRRLVSHLVPLAVREVREVPLQGRAPAEVLREEGKRLEAALCGARHVVALGVGGRAYDSPGFARWLQGVLEAGGVTFVIGGSLGLEETVVRRADELLSLFGPSLSGCRAVSWTERAGRSRMVRAVLEAEVRPEEPGDGAGLRSSPAP